MLFTKLLFHGRGHQRIDDTKKCRWIAWLPCGCGDRMWGTSTNGAHPGLHLKPLDAAIRRLPAPSYPPGGCHCWQIRWKNTKHQQNNNGTFWSLVVCENFNPEMDPLLSSSMQQAPFKCEMPRLELVNLWTFLDIKGSQGTKRKKVIRQSQSSLTGIRLWAQICAHLNLELRKCLITFPIFVPSQRLIARNVRELFSFNNACCIDDVSRGSLSCYEILTNN
jgi:hypothetical protein